jgi:RHS repeat-associated protein
VTADNHFTGQAVVPGGTGTVAVAARDMAGNVRTNTYQVSETGAGASFTYDANGNMTSDGSNTYTWDAENRLTAVTQTGGDSVTFAYDGRGRRTRVTELHAGNVVHDRRVVWCGAVRCQEIEGSAQTTFFAEGMVRNGESLFYTQDHLGSVREIVDVSGTLRERFTFDPYGRMQQTVSQTDWKLGFTGHAAELGGALVLPLYRPYSPSLAQWLTEDRVSPEMDLSLYAYARDNPVRFFDPDGAEASSTGGSVVKRCIKIGAALFALYGLIDALWKPVTCTAKAMKCDWKGDKKCDCANKEHWVPTIAENIGIDQNAGPRRECRESVEKCCQTRYVTCMAGGKPNWSECYDYLKCEE